MGKYKKENTQTRLKDINGIKFKSMWSSKILYFYLYIEYAAFAMAETACFIDSKESIVYSEFPKLIRFNIVLIIIALFLIFLNHKFLGRVVAVITEKGINSTDGFIAWKDIKELKYHARLPGKHMIKNDFFCTLSIFTKKNEYEIVHAPRIMMWYIKKKKQDIKIKFDYGLLIILLSPVIFGMIIGLCNK